MIEFLLILIIHAEGPQHRHLLEVQRWPDEAQCIASGLALQPIGTLDDDGFVCLPVAPIE